ncbi:MAG: nitroreductase family protein [Syntrophomonadaceae bacterium]|nr:nitroreductase family protein [Syntrophomonadaceae bacterium]
METRECIKTRRSIRRFTERPVSAEMIRELLEAVRWSPSWANTQCWEVIVIQDAQLKAELTSSLSETNPAYKGILQAPAVFVLCARTGRAGIKQGGFSTSLGDWYMFDGGIAAQNLCLAAHDMGLGSVHVGSFDHQKVDRLLKLPDDVRSLEIIPVGWPEKTGNPPPRRAVGEFAHRDSFGQPYND